MDQPAGSLKVGTCLAHGPTSHLKAGRLRLRYAYDVDQFGSVRAGTCLAHEPTSPLKAGRLRVKTCLAHGPSSPLKAGRLRVKTCLAHGPTSPLKAGRLRVNTCLAHGPTSPLKPGRLGLRYACHMDQDMLITWTNQPSESWPFEGKELRTHRDVAVCISNVSHRPSRQRVSS